MALERAVVATRNEHKLRELREILTGVELLPLPADVELPREDAETFADDSGIAASAIGGRPGPRSARYAGTDATDEENLNLLLSELVDKDDRSVAYVAALAYVDADGNEELVEGRCEGTLTEQPRGTGGFGYDPAFVPADTGPDDDRTMAELDPDEKHAISHRGRAARRLAEVLVSKW